MKLATKIGVGAMMAAASIGLAVPAQAASAAGSCSKGASTASFSTTYRTAGGYNQAVTYGVILSNSHRLGVKNNVQARHYKNNTASGDTLLDSFKSQDDIPANKWVTFPAGAAAKTKTSDRAHTRYDMVFDNTLTDDKCHADTNNF